MGPREGRRPGPLPPIPPQSPPGQISADGAGGAHIQMAGLGTFGLLVGGLPLTRCSSAQAPSPLNSDLAGEGGVLRDGC